MVWLRYWVRCGCFFIFWLVHLVGLNFWSLNLHLTLYSLLWEDKVQFEPELIADVVILCMLFFGVPFLVAPCIHAKHNRHVLNSCIQQNKVVFSSMIGWRPEPSMCWLPWLCKWCGHKIQSPNYADLWTQTQWEDGLTNGLMDGDYYLLGLRPDQLMSRIYFI